MALVVDNTTIKSMASDFARDGNFVRIPKEAMNPSVFKAIAAEAKMALQHSKRMAIEMDEEPRRLEIVGGDVLSEEGEYHATKAFARDPALLEQIRTITGKPNLVCGSYPPLSPAHINRQSGPGDTHGMHLDDAAYKLVLYVKMDRGEGEQGGDVRFIPGYVPAKLAHAKRDDRYHAGGTELEAATKESVSLMGRDVPTSALRMGKFDEGEAYLMEGRTVAHEVTPVTAEGTERITICFSFDDIADLSNYTRSADTLYPSHDNV